MRISYRIRLRVFEKDRFTCVICKKSPANDDNVKLQIDHIFPLCKGGTDEIENLQTLCAKCNNTKAGLLPPEIEKRQIKRKYNIKYIQYRLQTAENRKRRFDKFQCIIHGQELRGLEDHHIGKHPYAIKLKELEKSYPEFYSYICTKKHCDIFVYIWEGKMYLPPHLEYLMIGSFCWI